MSYVQKESFNVKHFDLTFVVCLDLKLSSRLLVGNVTRKQFVTKTLYAHIFDLQSVKKTN